MKTIVSFLLLFSALLADVRLITPEEAPPSHSVCYLYLIHCTPEQWKEQVESVIQRHDNIQGKPLFLLLDLKEEEILSTLTTLAKDHLGEEVIVATHAGVIQRLMAYLEINFRNIPPGSMMAIEVDSDTVYLRKNYARLWGHLFHLSQ
jgi:hypothetical protein